MDDFSKRLNVAGADLETGVGFRSVTQAGTIEENRLLRKRTWNKINNGAESFREMRDYYASSTLGRGFWVRVVQ